jgi:hypothetical protein
MLRALVKERGSLVVWKTPRDYVALQRDDTSVLRNYEATVSIAVRGSAFDANPGEDGILGSREISTFSTLFRYSVLIAPELPMQ